MAIPMVVALILGLASFLSWLPGTPARGAGAGAVAGAIGGPADAWPAPLTAIEPPDGTTATGRADGADGLAGVTVSPSGAGTATPPAFDLHRIDREAIAAARADQPPGPSFGAAFLPDGTLIKPVAVTTTVPDGEHLLRIHRIVKGDSLTTIGERYNISMMTIWWANDLRSQNLVVGKTLTIPPVDGLVVTVAEGDTLASLATEHDVDAARVLEVNELDDAVLVAGQTLTLPGAAGDPIPEPTPPAEAPGRVGGSTGGTAAPSVARGPATYSGGSMVWPVVGGNNYVSRGFRWGHYGLDVAADHGARVVAGAGGVVTFAGWKSNGGGYQVWISHGSGIYTTYNHMSAVSVGNGQSVGAGQQVGRIGASGNSTGPHLHFEVWRGPIWAGGARVNPASYL